MLVALAAAMGQVLLVRYSFQTGALYVALLLIVLGFGKDWLPRTKIISVVAWSWKLAPTAGMSFLTLMPAAQSTAAGPMPLTWRSWGV